MSTTHNEAPSCACLERSEPRQDFDMDLAKRLVLAEAKRIFPGESRCFEFRTGCMPSIRDAFGRVFVHNFSVVELPQDPGRKDPILIDEGTEDEGWIYCEPEPTVVIAGQYASNEVLAIEGLLNMARVTPELGAAQRVISDSLKEFKGNICASCGKVRLASFWQKYVEYEAIK